MTPEQPRFRSGIQVASGQVLPDLRIVPRAQVHLHEDADDARVQRLVARLRADGLLRNPPPAAPLPEGGFVVLDGANRTSALRALGASAVPLQVVAYEDPTVRLDVWHHLLTQPADLVGLLRAKNLSVQEADPAAAARHLSDRTSACHVLTSQGTFEVAATRGRPLPAILSTVVDTYRATNRIYRVMETDLGQLTDEYGPVAALVVFPTFTKQDILDIARAPAKLPTGITRHTIPRRALRVNIPLELLITPGDIEGKNHWLAEEIHRRVLEHRVRFYPESSFLFDE